MIWPGVENSVDNRRFERLHTFLMGNIVVNDTTYPVYIINMSKEGAYVRTAPLIEPVTFDPGTNLKLSTELSTGYSVSLSCAIVWSNETHPDGLVHEMGLKISNPPLEYLEYLKKEGFIEPEDLRTSEEEVF
ncbi:MAG TPA: PilZ domain-containing protein [Nitrospirae bacterium]|nr:PilZ domain-containing protein [Nitrospirota bacterium]